MLAHAAAPPARLRCISFTAAGDVRVCACGTKLRLTGGKACQVACRRDVDDLSVRMHADRYGHCARERARARDRAIGAPLQAQKIARQARTTGERRGEAGEIIAMSTPSRAFRPAMARSVLGWLVRSLQLMPSPCQSGSSLGRCTRRV